MLLPGLFLCGVAYFLHEQSLGRADSAGQALGLLNLPGLVLVAFLVNALGAILGPDLRPDWLDAAILYGAIAINVTILSLLGAWFDRRIWPPESN